MEAYLTSLNSLSYLFNQKQEFLDEKDYLDNKIKEVNADSFFYNLKYYMTFKFLFSSKSKENQILDCQINKNIVTLLVLLLGRRAIKPSKYYTENCLFGNDREYNQLQKRADGGVF